MRRFLSVIALATVAACAAGGGDSEDGDGGSAGAGAGAEAAAGAGADSGADSGVDSGGGGDAGGVVDASEASASIDAAADGADAGAVSANVHILIDNFCNTSTQPASFTVPKGQTLKLTWHNDSVDYDADVWLSYGGGYLGLVQGGTWSDPFVFCSMSTTYDAYADVSIAGGGGSACPSFRMMIHCHP